MQRPRCVHGFVRDLARRLHRSGQKSRSRFREVRPDFDRPLRLLRLAGARPRSRTRVRDELGLALDNVLARSPGRSCRRFTKVADYAATMPNKPKYVLGMPMLRASTGPTAAAPPTPRRRDGVRRRHGPDRQLGATPDPGPVPGRTLALRVQTRAASTTTSGTRTRTPRHAHQIAKARGLGVGLWRLGREDQGSGTTP